MVVQFQLALISGHLTREMLEHYSHVRMAAQRSGPTYLVPDWEAPGSGRRSGGESELEMPVRGGLPHNLGFVCEQVPVTV